MELSEIWAPLRFFCIEDTRAGCDEKVKDRATLRRNSYWPSTDVRMHLRKRKNRGFSRQQGIIFFVVLETGINASVEELAYRTSARLEVHV